VLIAICAPYSLAKRDTVVKRSDGRVATRSIFARRHVDRHDVRIESRRDAMHMRDAVCTDNRDAVPLRIAVFTHSPLAMIQ